MYRKTFKSLALPILVFKAAILGTTEGAIVIDSEEYECTKLVTKLTDLLLENDKKSESSKLLRVVLSRKLARDCGLHVVRHGDTLSGIASQYNISLVELRRLNPEIKNFRPPLSFAQVLKIREFRANHALHSTEASSAE